MFFEHAMNELPLLIFSVLVPAGVTAMGLAGLVRGTAEVDAKKADAMLAIPAILTILGLLAAFAHLGSPMKAFGMMSGLGTSPLSNEIIVAGIAILVAVVYWILAVVKHPEAGLHKTLGIACLALGVIVAAFTGLAYMMPTIPTWNSPLSTISQVCAALLGGAALASLVIAFAGGKQQKLVSLIGVAGAAGVIILVIAQGVTAGGVQNAAGMTLDGVMSTYWFVAVAGIICAVLAAVLMFVNAGKQGSGITVTVLVTALAAIAGLVLVRMCFYGIFISVGLF